MPKSVQICPHLPLPSPVRPHLPAAQHPHCGGEERSGCSQKPLEGNTDHLPFYLLTDVMYLFNNTVAYEDRLVALCLEEKNQYHYKCTLCLEYFKALLCHQTALSNRESKQIYALFIATCLH